MAEIRRFTMNFGFDMTSATPTSVSTEVHGTSRIAVATRASLGGRLG